MGEQSANEPGPQSFFEVRRYTGILVIRFGRLAVSFTNNKQRHYHELALRAEWRNKAMRSIGGEVVFGS